MSGKERYSSLQAEKERSKSFSGDVAQTGTAEEIYFRILKLQERALD